MNFYRAFDLRIASEISLPELVAAEPNLGEAGDTANAPAAEVWVRLGVAPHSSWMPQDGAEHDAHFELQAAYFYWEAVGTFAALNGREIWVQAAPSASPDLVRLPLLGAVIAAILEQRGDFVLHAGAVEILCNASLQGVENSETESAPLASSQKTLEETPNGGAAVFLGWKGAGKSTMTAALWKAGHRLLSDDIVAIRSGPDGKPWVYPGFPQFKLWPASAEGALGEAAGDLPELHEATEKRTRLAFEGFSLAPSPLRAIFALEPVLPDDTEAPDVAVKTLAASERIAQLITNSYAARWGNDLLRGAGGGEHFRRCAQLATSVPVLSLQRRMDMVLLPQVVSLVEETIFEASPTVQRTSPPKAEISSHLTPAHSS